MKGHSLLLVLALSRTVWMEWAVEFKSVVCLGFYVSCTAWASSGQLTHSLPWRHFKTSIKRVKLQILKRFWFLCFGLFVCFVCFSFVCALRVNRFTSKCTELKVDLLQDLEKILFAGVCLHFSARKFHTVAYSIIPRSTREGKSPKQKRNGMPSCFIVLYVPAQKP